MLGNRCGDDLLDRFRMTLKEVVDVVARVLGGQAGETVERRYHLGEVHEKPLLGGCRNPLEERDVAQGHAQIVIGTAIGEEKVTHVVLGRLVVSHACSEHGEAPVYALRTDATMFLLFGPFSWTGATDSLA